MSEEKQNHPMHERVASIVMRYNLPAIGVLVAIEIVCVVIINDKTLIAVISTATGGVITALLNERLMLIQYFFGSSHGSKSKEKIIDQTIKNKKEE